jgi:GNAT superfamily N-acetyltransferase
MPELEIRPYEARHLRATTRLWLDSFLSAGLSTGKDTPFEHLLERVERETVLVWEAWLAWEENRLAGFLALKVPETCLDQIFIAPDAKGAGRGTRLLDFAKSRMPGGFWLRAAADNTVARRFYEKHGMTAGPLEPHPALGHLTVVYRWPADVTQSRD